jgi:aspartyl-tRNA(Asn)/glutamyl-tRNA(Gln) amidotransferase subunit B
VANFITGELASALNRSNLIAAKSPLGAQEISALLNRLIDGTISNKIAKDIFSLMWEEALNGRPVTDVDQIIESRGLKQITDVGALETLIDSVLEANAKSVEEFRSGKEKAFNALVGQVMKASQGKANPQQLNELLRKKLQSS